MLGWHFFSHKAPMAISLVFFIGLSVTAEVLPVSLPRGGQVSVGFAIWLASIFLFGPTGGSIVAASAALSIPALLRKDPPVKFFFNAAQYTISATLSGLVFIGLRGATLMAVPQIGLPADFLPFVAAATVFYVINSSLITAVIALTGEIGFRRIWLLNVYPFMPNFAAMTALATTMAILHAKTSYFGLLLLIVPLMVARQTFHLYSALRESHISTIKSLIASIEAKDTYTRGHSERVAEIAVKIGRRMGLSEKVLERLEYAALLHDIGKIGIPKSILLKPSHLDDQEYNEVKKHPFLGAMIVEEIEFLHDIVPVVFHHHERLDGRGYVDGLKGEGIPLLARILAVADSFDAMTSERAYRPPYPLEDAARELADNAGNQFDRNVVQAFMDTYYVNRDAKINSGQEIT